MQSWEWHCRHFAVPYNPIMGETLHCLCPVLMVQLLLCTRRTLLREAFCGGLLGLPSSCLLLGFCWPKTFFSEFSGVDLSVFLFPPVACTLGPISMDVREREGHDRWPRVGWNIALTAPVAVFVMFTFLFYSLNCAVWPLCLCWISVRSHLWNQGFRMEEIWPWVFFPIP